MAAERSKCKVILTRRLAIQLSQDDTDFTGNTDDILLELLHAESHKDLVHNGHYVDNIGHEDTVDNFAGARQTVDPPNITGKQPYTFTILDFFLMIFSVTFFCIDIITDLFLAEEYYFHGRVAECALTLTLLIMSLLFTGILSTFWYIQEYTDTSDRNLFCCVGKGVPRCCFIFLIILTFPFATIVRNLSYVYHGCKSRLRETTNKRKHYIEMIASDRDASFLRMVDAFIESAPQLVLQLYIAIHGYPEEKWHLEFIRLMKMVVAAVSIAWSLTSYYRALRVSVATTSRERTFCAAVGHFLWRSFEFGPRVVAIVMIFSMNTLIAVLTLAFHWVAMTTWSFAIKVKPYKYCTENTLFCIFMGFVQVFCFVNLKRGDSRYLAAFYYTFFYLENSVILLLWIFLCDIDNYNIYLGAIITVPAGLVFNAIFMILFYKCCHPKKSILSY